MRTLDIKPFYTIREIQKFLGYKKPDSALSFLRKIPVALHLTGKRYIVYLTDIKSGAPELYSSILEVNHLSNLMAKQDESVDPVLINELL